MTLRITNIFCSDTDNHFQKSLSPTSTLMSSSKWKLFLLLLQTRRQNKALLKMQSVPPAVCAFMAGFLILCEHHHHHHLWQTGHGSPIVEEGRVVLGATQTHGTVHGRAGPVLRCPVLSHLRKWINFTPFLAVTKPGAWMHSVDKKQLC